MSKKNCFIINTVSNSSTVISSFKDKKLCSKIITLNNILSYEMKNYVVLLLFQTNYKLVAKKQFM